MIELKVIFGIIILHWIADFIMQTDKEAQNKSTSFKWLLSHTVRYSVIWMAAGIPIFGVKYAVLFGVITFITHTLTDFITSKITKYFWEKEKVHNFFIVIGFDQVLHYIQLFLTYYYLTK